MRETDKIRFRLMAPRILTALTKKQYEAGFFETIPEAKSFILGRIEPGETVGIGGSITLREDMQIVEAIRSKGNEVYDHWGAGQRFMEVKRMHRQVDVFLSGINAFTGDGIIVNIDGGGNRVGSLCSGPKRVIAVAGPNKLTESLDSAISRVRNKAAVLNAIRVKVKTPCVETGLCNDCSSSERICAALLILMKKPTDIEQFTVVLINEELGY